MPEQLLIGYNALAAQNRVVVCGNQIRSRLVWLVIAVIISVWIYVWQRQTLTPLQAGLLVTVGVVYSGVWLIVAVVQWQRAKRALAGIMPGVAMAVDRRGIWLAGLGLAWPDIATVGLLPGRGGSPDLVVSSLNGQTTGLPLANLEVMPGTIDAAIRAYSSGSRWLDTSKLGN